MTITLAAPADAAVPARSGEVLARVAAARGAADAAEVEVLVAAAEWADLHPAQDERVDRRWEVPQPGPVRVLTAPECVALSEFHPDVLDADGNLCVPMVATGTDADVEDAAT